MSGIFGCGSSKNSAILAALKSVLRAIVANGGASPVVPRWFGATTWHAAHQRAASRPPLDASAAIAADAAETATAVNSAARGNLLRWIIEITRLDSDGSSYSRTASVVPSVSYLACVQISQQQRGGES